MNSHIHQMNVQYADDMGHLVSENAQQRPVTFILDILSFVQKKKSVVQSPYAAFYPEKSSEDCVALLH